MTTLNIATGYAVGNFFQGNVVVSVDSAVYATRTKKIIISNATNPHLEDGAIETVYAQDITIRAANRDGTPVKGSRKHKVVAARVRSEVERIPEEIGKYTNIWIG